MKRPRPRLAVTPDDAALLARALVPDETSGEPRGDPARGAALYQRLACAGCHRFTGATVDRPVVATPATAVAVALAPDLRHARDRLAPGALVAWLRDPAAVEPATRMPRPPITETEAHDLAAFLVRAELTPPPPPAPPPARLPPPERPVGWDEVAAKVFRKVCWHCHGQPDFALGDGGPGNSGGFGFAPRGLDLSSSIGVSSGSFGPDGRRRSVFAPLPDGTPRLVAHLLARQVEERGEVIDGVRGMPLGFPSLSPEDVQLVESWIAQGRPP